LFPLQIHKATPVAEAEDAGADVAGADVAEADVVGAEAGVDADVDRNTHKSEGAAVASRGGEAAHTCPCCSHTADAWVVGVRSADGA
jgi:hypothetical protein